MDCFGLSLWGIRKVGRLLGPCFGISFLGAGEGQGNAVSEEMRQSSASFSFPVKQQPADTQRQDLPRLQSC